MSSILWRRLGTPGHESARIELREGEWRLEGTAVFLHETEPCRLDYVVRCDDRFRTLHGKVRGWLGARTVDVAIEAEWGRWRLGDRERPEVEGAVDLDLNFSPATNLLPIRRLELAIGERCAVRAAWLRFPSFELEPLEQSYTRVGGSTYLYESATGFSAELEVDASGFVTVYSGAWQKEGPAGP